MEGFIKVMNGLVMTLKEDKLAAHSQYSLPVEALNVIVELSKSLPVPLREIIRPLSYICQLIHIR